MPQARTRAAMGHALQLQGREQTPARQARAQQASG